MFVPWEESYDKPRQCITKQRHRFADRGPSSQSYGFSSSHIQVWQLDHQEKKKKKKDRHTIDILVPKGRNWKGEKGDRSQKIQIKLSKANYIWCSGWRITFLVLRFCPPEPLGWEHNPVAVASTLPLQLWTEAPSIQLFGVNCPWATGQQSLAGQSEEETAAGPWWERKPGWSLSYPLHPSLFLEDKACWQPACSVALCCSLWSDLAVLLLISSHPYSRRLLRWFTCTVYLSDDFSVHILEHIPPLFFFCKIHRLRILQIFKFWHLSAQR